MGGQLGDEPFRQRLEAVIFVGLSLALTRTPGADCDDSAPGRAAWLTFGPSLLILRLDRLYRRLVLWTNIAALDPQCPLAVDADERAGMCDLGEIIDDRPVIERCQHGLDFPEPPVDLFGYFVNFCVLLLKPIKLGFECIAGGGFLVGQIDGASVKPPQACRVAIGKVG